MQARYKLSLDPTVEDVKKVCTSMRKNAKDERVVFHYNVYNAVFSLASCQLLSFRCVSCASMDRRRRRLHFMFRCHCCCWFCVFRVTACRDRRTTAKYGCSTATTRSTFRCRFTSCRRGPACRPFTCSTARTPA
jgi:hypothetical protein